MSRLVISALLAVSAAALPLRAEPLINLSGDARFGVTYSDGREQRFDPYSALRLDTHVSTVTDNGIRLGAQVRLYADDPGQSVPGYPRFYFSTGRPATPPSR